MDLYEHQGKDIFRAHGIPTPRGIVAATPEEAAAATVELGGRSVVKVQVQIGGRGKGGGVVLVDSPERAAEEAARMFREGFGDLTVDRVLVEELLPIAEEFYTSFVLDRSTGDLSRHDDGGGRRRHRGAGADASGSDPARARGRDARPADVPRPRADRNAPARGA